MSTILSTRCTCEISTNLRTVRTMGTCRCNICPRSLPVESPRASSRSEPREPQQRACRQTFQEMHLWKLHGLLHGHQGYLSLNNNGNLQDLQLWNLRGLLHSEDHGTTGTSTTVHAPVYEDLPEPSADDHGPSVDDPLWETWPSVDNQGHP